MKRHNSSSSTSTTKLVIIVVTIVCVALYLFIMSLSPAHIIHEEDHDQNNQKKNSGLRRPRNNINDNHHVEEREDGDGTNNNNDNKKFEGVQIINDKHLHSNVELEAQRIRKEREHELEKKARLQHLREHREEELNDIRHKMKMELKKERDHQHEHEQHHNHNEEGETSTSPVKEVTSTEPPTTTSNTIAPSSSSVQPQPLSTTTTIKPTFDRDINRERELEIRARAIQKYKPTTNKPAEEIVPGTVPRSWLKAIEEGKVHDEAMDDKELAEKMADVDIIYTWVNGSEMVHRWKKSQIVGKLVSEANSRDRDSDELRHSMRSIFKHLKWHTGRISVVSNGHVPSWMDLSNPRMRVIHQDAIALDEQERFTFNTNSIEQNLWRIPSLSHQFIQFNDDYFVMRDCPPSTFFNEHGGPVLLYENGVVNGGMKQVKKFLKDGGKVWVAGVFHTHALIQTLVPRDKRLFWKYIKHAPFTYCKSYLQALQTRAFPGVYHRASRHNRFRNHLDVLTPFIHHAFSFGSPDILLSNRSLRKAQQDALEKAHSEEDKNDIRRFYYPLFEKDFREDREGDLPTCPPVTWKTGHAADSRLVVLKDDPNYNRDAVRDALRGNYQFITLNDGFGNGNLIGKQLFELIDGWFPNRSHFEVNGKYELTKTEFEKLRNADHHLTYQDYRKRNQELEDKQKKKNKKGTADDDNQLDADENSNDEVKKSTSSNLKQHQENEEVKKQQPPSRDKHQELRTLHKSLNTGKFGVVLFASTCDGLCSSIRSCDLGFSRLQTRIAPPEKQPKTPSPPSTTTTEEPTTTTTTATSTTKRIAGDDDVGEHEQVNHNTTTNNNLTQNTTLSLSQRFPKATPLPTDIVDPLGETTFYVIPTYFDDDDEGDLSDQSKEGKSSSSSSSTTLSPEDDEKRRKKKGDKIRRLTLLRKQLTRCRCPLGSFQHIDTEEYDTVPRIFQMRNDTVHIETDLRYFVKAEKTNFATAFHAERDFRLEVRNPEVLKKVVYRARDELTNSKYRFPASLPLMVLTTVDPVFGEAVTAGKITDTVDYDDLSSSNSGSSEESSSSGPVGVVHFAPLPSSVHPRNRQPQLRSDVLLLPEHARLSYLRTYPIPSTRNYEIPLKKFLRFFLLSYRTGTLGFNPNFVRKKVGVAPSNPNNNNNNNNNNNKPHEDHNHQENHNHETVLMKIHEPTLDKKNIEVRNKKLQQLRQKQQETTTSVEEHHGDA